MEKRWISKMTDSVVSLKEHKEKEFVAPDIADIRMEWDNVRPGIEEILSDTPQLTFLPEDVYSECVNDRATLLTSPAGFVILTIESDPFTRDRTLLIWLAYMYVRSTNSWLDHMEWFEGVARGLQCKFIEMRSAVPKMEAYASRNGWSLDTKVYTREVSGE
jgi:hypothetical protein